MNGRGWETADIAATGDWWWVLGVVLIIALIPISEKVTDWLETRKEGDNER